MLTIRQCAYKRANKFSTLNIGYSQQLHHSHYHGKDDSHENQRQSLKLAFRLLFFSITKRHVNIDGKILNTLKRGTILSDSASFYFPRGGSEHGRRDGI